MIRGSFTAACAGCFVVAWLLCEAAAAILPAGGTGFRGAMARRVALMLGRAAIVLGVVAAAIRLLRANAVGVIVGAILGWLAAAGRLAWREHRALQGSTGGRLG